MLRVIQQHKLQIRQPISYDCEILADLMNRVRGKWNDYVIFVLNAGHKGHIRDHFQSVHCKCVW